MGVVEDKLSFVIQIIIIMMICNALIFSVVKNLIYSTVLSILKLSVLFLYFIFFIKYIQFNLLDDLNYYFSSLKLYDLLGRDVTRAFTAEGFDKAGSVAGGFHFGYYIVNVIAFSVFGEHYYAPVLFNMPVSVLSAIYIYKTIRLAGVENPKAKLFFIFFLLHWETLSWQSFFNLKDSWVLFLTIMTIYNMIYLKLKGFNFFNLLGIVIACFVFSLIRFYYAYLLIMVMIVFYSSYLFRMVKSRWVDIVLKALIFGAMPLCFYIFFSVFMLGEASGLKGRSNVVFGGIRYVLTPIPFQISEEYYFLLVSSIMHWLTLPFTLYGLYIVVKRHFNTLMPWLILFLTVVVFYGSFKELQGPRHRIPMVGILSLCQFMGLYEFFVFLSSKRQSRISETKAVVPTDS